MQFVYQVECHFRVYIGITTIRKFYMHRRKLRFQRVSMRTCLFLLVTISRLNTFVVTCGKFSFG